MQRGGFTIRTYRGPEDEPGILAVEDRSHAADGIEWRLSLPELRHSLANAVGWRPTESLVLAEAGGQIVGTSRPAFLGLHAGDGAIWAFHMDEVDPAWRERGVGEGLLAAIHARLGAMLETCPEPGERRFASHVDGRSSWARELLEADGYRWCRAEYLMVRDLADPIDDHPLPDGVEIRRCPPDRIRDVIRAGQAAFEDLAIHAIEDAASREARLEMLASEPIGANPAEWVVAWSGDEVVGCIRGWIDRPENERLGRRRGYTEAISVDRRWRRRGIASAMIAAHLRLLRDLGMTESALTVDTNNPSGALRVYERSGFRIVGEDPYLARPVARRGPAAG